MPEEWASSYSPIYEEPDIFDLILEEFLVGFDYMWYYCCLLVVCDGGEELDAAAWVRAGRSIRAAKITHRVGAKPRAKLKWTFSTFQVTLC